MTESETSFSIVVTRAKKQAATMMERFAEAGYYPVLMPSIGIATVEPDVELEEELRGLKDGRFSWLILTSPNGVKSLEELLTSVTGSSELPSGLQVAVQGPKTAALFKERFNRPVDLIPIKYVSEVLLESLRKKHRSGERYFVGAARRTREIIVKGLRREGAEVHPVVLYQTTSVAAEKFFTASAGHHLTRLAKVLARLREKSTTSQQFYLVTITTSNKCN